MTKETIETLTNLTKSQLRDINDYIREWEDVLSEETNVIYQKKVIHLQKCIDELNALKLFEWPTLDEIIIESESEFLIATDTFDEKSFIKGAKWAIEQIKSKL